MHQLVSELDPSSQSLIDRLRWKGKRKAHSRLYRSNQDQTRLIYPLSLSISISPLFLLISSLLLVQPLIISSRPFGCFITSPLSFLCPRFRFLVLGTWVSREPRIHHSRLDSILRSILLSSQDSQRACYYSCQFLCSPNLIRCSRHNSAQMREWLPVILMMIGAVS